MKGAEGRNRMASLALKDSFRKLIPSSLKRVLASIVVSDTVGWLIRRRGATIDVKGCAISIDDPRISNREVAALYFDLRERAEADIVDNCLPIDGESTVVELGTSIGYLASIAARHKPRRLILVEPDDTLLEIARENTKLNAGARTEIVFERAAISYGETASVMFARGATTTSGKTVVRDPRLNYETVETTTLMQLLRKHNVRSYLLIADIEGAEADIWFRDEEALAGCQAIVVELEDCNTYRIADQIERIHDLGFVESYSYGHVYCFKKCSGSS
jgi:FkbM family methyltransferase